MPQTRYMILVSSWMPGSCNVSQGGREVNHQLPFTMECGKKNKEGTC